MNATSPKTRQSRPRSAQVRPPLLATAAALALATGGHAAAATVLSAGWESGCGAATCFDNHGTYAITFSASAFKGPVDISKLLLSRSILGNMDSHFFSLSFQLNGHQVGSWGDWNMSSVGGDELSFTGSDLVWNPADGDLVLVMDLVAPNGEKLIPDGQGGWYVPGGSGGGGGFAAAPPAPDDGDQGFGDGAGQGSFVFDIPPVDVPNGDPPPPVVVTGGSRTAGPVPEPATWAMMVGGFGLAGWALRRRATVTARTA
jgi:hypothetical protein